MKRIRKRSQVISTHTYRNTPNLEEGDPVEPCWIIRKVHDRVEMLSTGDSDDLGRIFMMAGLLVRWKVGAAFAVRWKS